MILWPSGEQYLRVTLFCFSAIVWTLLPPDSIKYCIRHHLQNPQQSEHPQPLCSPKHAFPTTVCLCSVPGVSDWDPSLTKAFSEADEISTKFLTCFNFLFLSFTDKFLSLMMFSKSSATAAWEVETFCSSNSSGVICLQYEYVGNMAPISSFGYLHWNKRWRSSVDTPVMECSSKKVPNKQRSIPTAPPQFPIKCYNIAEICSCISLIQVCIQNIVVLLAVFPSCLQKRQHPAISSWTNATDLCHPHMFYVISHFDLQISWYSKYLLVMVH